MCLNINGYICVACVDMENIIGRMASNVPSMFLPDNIFGNGFSNGVQHEVFSPPSSLSGISMETNAPLFNDNYTDGMSTWTKNLPNPTAYDSNNEPGMDETAQSQNEIVQKVLIVPTGSRKSFEQHDFFFINNTTQNTTRAYYSSQSRYPYKALTLKDMRIDHEIRWMTIKELVEKYNPMGAMFNYVAFEEQKTASKLVAYSLGGLSDVLNVWHVTIVPGTTLYFVAYKDNEDKTCIIPYAGLRHPMDKTSRTDSTTQISHPWTNHATETVAVLEVGIVCAGNSRQPLQLKNYPYLTNVDNNPICGTMDSASGNIDPTDPTCIQVRGNILRIRMSCLQWQLF